MAWPWQRWVLGDEPSALESLVGREQYDADIRRVTALWTGVVPILVIVADLAIGDLVGERGRLFILVSMMATIVLWLMVFRAATDVHLWFATMTMVLCPVALIDLAIVGPQFASAASVIPAVVCLGFVGLTRRNAVLVTTFLLAGHSVLVLVVDGYPRPAAQILPTFAFTVTAALGLYLLVGRIHEVAQRSLVAADRLGQYVAPQVAAAVRDDLDLTPHRQRIGVWFCDLRGFTAFAAGAEPEEVVDVLGDYYAVVGDLATDAGATIGAFAGDGIHGYFGDPVAHDDPAGAAVRLALELRPALDALASRWRAHGFTLGYGIGIAYGYATLGTVGYEGRRDYTALGSVVNLAARLCGEAGPGEVLLDSKAAAAVPSLLTTERSVTLKGFPDPLPAFVVAT